MAAAAGAGAWWYSRSGAEAPASAAAKNAPPTAEQFAFKGGDQGFISLKLEEVETLNHNTKRFRFLLPEGDNVSGLSVACKSELDLKIIWHRLLTLEQLRF